MQGCDGSMLLEDTTTFQGEKTAPPNLNSLRGFEVIDAIKLELESVFPETVSCADVLAIASRNSVFLVIMLIGKFKWGRKDGLSASKAAATASILGPNSTVAVLATNFQNVGLSLNDVVALSVSGAAVLAVDDDGGGAGKGTPFTFDNQYYVNLMSREGQLPSDQALA
ncbi:unnamed protein product [Linum tenue]|uniref:peroxidase n=1 Tax=Linum tenue TaxID=586396 RepID=A0AAV0S389_9ROSI|nr:unnamed protein product [Linum tenue]